MKESQFIGTLMPSHPDFQPIIQEIREKYRLPKVDLNDEAIFSYMRDCFALSGS